MRVGPAGGEEFVTDAVYAYYISGYGDAVYVSDGAGLDIWENGSALYTDAVPIANLLCGTSCGCCCFWMC